MRTLGPCAPTFRSSSSSPNSRSQPHAAAPRPAGVQCVAVGIMMRLPRRTELKAPDREVGDRDATAVKPRTRPGPRARMCHRAPPPFATAERRAREALRRSLVAQKVGDPTGGEGRGEDGQHGRRKFAAIVIGSKMPVAGEGAQPRGPISSASCELILYGWDRKSSMRLPCTDAARNKRSPAEHDSTTCPGCGQDWRLRAEGVLNILGRRDRRARPPRGS
jgi:hypothetical protein